MNRPPNLSGPRVLKNKGAREAETCDEWQNFMIRHKNNWRENIRVGEEKREATGKLCPLKSFRKMVMMYNVRKQ